MRRIFTLTLILVAGFAGYFYGIQQIHKCYPVTISQNICHVYFSPNGGCTEAVVNELDKAKSNILVQAYSFTSEPIAKALVDAHKRGVNVQVILDKSQRTEEFSEADFIAHVGIRTLIDPVHAIAHNKIMIIDNQVVITGSFNFTKAAEEHNAENLLAIHDVEMAKRYTENWKGHEGHSEVYNGR